MVDICKHDPCQGIQSNEINMSTLSIESNEILSLLRKKYPGHEPGRDLACR